MALREERGQQHTLPHGIHIKSSLAYSQHLDKSGDRSHLVPAGQGVLTR